MTSPSFRVRWGIRFAGRVGNFFRTNPEWVLVAVALLAVLAGLIRTALMSKE